MKTTILKLLLSVFSDRHTDRLTTDNLRTVQYENVHVLTYRQTDTGDRADVRGSSAVVSMMKLQKMKGF